MTYALVLLGGAGPDRGWRRHARHMGPIASLHRGWARDEAVRFHATAGPAHSLSSLLGAYRRARAGLNREAGFGSDG